MPDQLTLCEAPYDVSCAQFGTPNYAERAQAECRAYIGQLRRLFKTAHGTEPPCGLEVRSNTHDFGVYYDVAASYTGPAALEAALWLDSNLPSDWDHEAATELGLWGESADLSAWLGESRLGPS